MTMKIAPDDEIASHCNQALEISDILNKQAILVHEKYEVMKSCRREDFSLDN